jgi:hypothetical protein
MSSDNLTNWTSVATGIVANSNGNMTYFNPSIVPNKFYTVASYGENTSTNHFDGLRINFSPSEVNDAQHGFFRDSGATFGQRNNGLLYGWNFSNSLGFVEGNLATNDPIRNSAMILLRTNTFTNFWEISIPNGWYDVRVQFGETNWDVGGYAADIEDVYAIKWSSFYQTNAYGEGNAIVNVKD